MLYPLNVDLTGRRVVIIGGGAVAERKVRGILSTCSSVELQVVSPTVTEGLHALAADGQILWQADSYQRGLLSGAFLVYAATDVRAVNRMVADEAKVLGIPVNVIDDPAASSFQIPSAVRRGELLLTISTGGGSPALARAIRMEIEQLYPDAFGAWLKRVACLRTDLRECLPTSVMRTEFWRMALCPKILAMVRDGELEKAEVELRNAALDIGAQSPNGAG